MLGSGITRRSEQSGRRYLVNLTGVSYAEIHQPDIAVAVLYHYVRWLYVEMIDRNAVQIGQCVENGHHRHDNPPRKIVELSEIAVDMFVYRNARHIIAHNKYRTAVRKRLAEADCFYEVRMAEPQLSLFAGALAHRRYIRETWIHYLDCHRTVVGHRAAGKNRSHSTLPERLALRIKSKLLASDCDIFRRHRYCI